MTRRSFFAALAVLPFVPDALKKIAEMKTGFQGHYSYVEGEGMILGYWIFDSPEDERRYHEWLKGSEFQEILKHAR